MDMSQFECSCKNPSISPGDKLFAKKFGISEEEAHALMDATEDTLDESLTAQWNNR